MTVQIIALWVAIAYAWSFILSKRGFKNSTPITITFVSLLIQSVTLFTIALTVTGIRGNDCDLPDETLTRFSFSRPHIINLTVTDSRN